MTCPREPQEITPKSCWTIPDLYRNVRGYDLYYLFMYERSSLDVNNLYVHLMDYVEEGVYGACVLDIYKLHCVSATTFDSQARFYTKKTVALLLYSV